MWGFGSLHRRGVVAGGGAAQAGPCRPSNPWRWVVVQDDQEGRFAVVINDEEQYSIWPEGRDVPAGWRGVGVSGSREECLAHVEDVWTDQRPLSVRR
ncbi:MbtH family protein [Streptomyces sp. NPDC006711]|uniref:MbtH family protein n=1 Tax=unclassified Streptomyces TaxID=2593676 RepID=UPI0036ADA254